MSPHGASRWSLVVPALVFALVASTAHRVEARAQYKSAFQKMYPKVGKDEGKRINCLVCHSDGDSKRRLNHYGDALAKELAEKNVKDQEKIKEALKAIEDGECKSGKWKERLDNGLAPCVCGSRDHDADSYIGRWLESRQ